MGKFDEYKDKLVYLSGPMTGLPNHNSDGFHRMEDELRQRGFTRIFNPISISEEFGLDHDYNFYMRKALEKMMTADAIYVFGDYSKSRGVHLEIKLAHTVGIPVFYEEYND